jgi:hypothetical protein
MTKLDTLTPKPKTYIAIILDKSGSMHGREKFAVNSFNEQVQVARAAENQDISITLTEFNEHVDIKVYNENVESAKEILIEEYRPNGGTALNDAIGYTISKLRQEPDIDDDNTSVLILVITDGYENASQEYKNHNIKSLIEELQGTDRWTFTYLGTDGINLEDIQKSYGLDVDSTLCIPSFESEFSATVSSATSNYLGGRAAGMTRSKSFYDGGAKKKVDKS